MLLVRLLMLLLLCWVDCSRKLALMVLWLNPDLLDRDLIALHTWRRCGDLVVSLRVVLRRFN